MTTQIHPDTNVILTAMEIAGVETIGELMEFCRIHHTSPVDLPVDAELCDNWGNTADVYPVRLTYDNGGTETYIALDLGTVGLDDDGVNEPNLMLSPVQAHVLARRLMDAVAQAV